MKNELKKITISSIMIALALVLSYVDSLIIIIPGIPGVKMGLANIAIVFILYKINYKYAITIAILKVILSSILFGSSISFMYGFIGTILSLSIMIILKSFTTLKIITISVIGAILHNTGQIIVAIFMLTTYQIIYYLPILIITGLISGMGVGLLSYLIIKSTKSIKLD